MHCQLTPLHMPPRPRQPATGWRHALLALLLGVVLPAQANGTAPTTLSEAVRQALGHDPEVRMARHRLDGARAQQAQARSRWFPSVGFNTVAGRADVIDVGQDFERRNGRTEAYARLNLFNSGQDVAVNRAAGHDHEGARLELARALQQSAERTALAYLEALRRHTLARDAQERLQDVQTLAAAVDRLVNSGKSPESDRHAAQASLADAQVAAKAAQLDAELALKRLSVLMGTPPGELLPPDLPDIPVAQALQQAEPGAAAQLNPGWMAARERATSARVRLGTFQPELLPKIDLEWRKVLHDTTFPVSSSNTLKSWSVNIAYDMPLGGATFARRDEGLALAAEAEGQADLLAQQIELGVTDALTEIHSATQVGPIYQRQLRHLQSVVSAGTLQYTAGRRDLIDLIVLRDAPYGVRQKLAENTRQRHSAAVRYWALHGQLLGVLGLDALLP